MKKILTISLLFSLNITISQTAGQGVIDADGNHYNTVIIGSQEWMSENLKTTKYCNGDVLPINNNASGGQWGNLIVGAWNLISPNYPNNGKFYNWYAAVDSRNICPCNWHVPTDDEWTVLENYLISNGFNYDGTSSGNKIGKSMSSQNPTQNLNWTSSVNVGAVGNNTTTNNSSGFNATPDGSSWNGYGINKYAFWWTTNSWTNDNNYALWRGLSYQDNYFLSGAPDIGLKTAGFSIRCVKNAPSTPVSVTVPANIKCDSNNGFSVFDLTINNSIIQAGQPVSTFNYIISYHETLINANNSTNALQPENYYNIIPYNQTIYYRVQDPLTSEFAVGSIQLIVHDAPVAVALNPIVVCDQDNNPYNASTLVDLTVQTPYIIGSLSPANYTVTYYTSSADAIAGINPIVNPNNYQGYSSQTIWYRIQDNATTCNNTGSFQIEINLPLALITLLPFSICDNDAIPNDLFTTFDLTLYDTSFNQGTGYMVTYYPSSPITSSSVAITNPTSYTNITPAIQTLGVRVTTPQGCYSDTTFDIRVLPVPSAPNNVPAIIKPCNANIVYFDLTVNSAYIINGAPFVTLHYFPTMADAEQNINEITNPTAYPYGGSNIWIKITNNRIDYQDNYCYDLVEQQLVVSNAPTVTQPSYSPYILNDNGNDGYETFDLTSQVNSILLGQSGMSVTFYPSLANAQNNTNPITNTTNYTNTTIYNQTLGIRVTNNTTGCYNISTMDIGVLSLGINDNDVIPLQFAPNPVKTNLELQSTIVLQSVIIYNVLGQKVYEKRLHDTSAILDLSNLQTGNYLVKIIAETGQKIIRIVKE